MAISKKSFVNLDLQGNSLVNPTIGLNSNMTKAGSFQYNDAEFRLEYFNGTLVEQVANLSDISAVTGGLIFQGGYDPTTNTPDITVDNGTVLKGYFWVATAAGTFLGETVQVGDSIIAKQNNPGTTAANWLILQGNVVIATTEVDGIVRLATQEEVNTGTEGGAVVLTPATLQGKIDAQITPEINNKLPLAGGIMSGSIDMGGNNITNVEHFEVNHDIIADAIAGSRVGGLLLNTNLNADDSATIVNLPAPTNGGDAANKTYVDTAASTAQANAEAYADSLAPNYDAAGSAATAQANAEAYADSLAPNYDPAGAAATAESNANTYTDTEIAIVNQRINDLSGSSLVYAEDWTLTDGIYTFNQLHNLFIPTPKVACYVSGQLVEFGVLVIDNNNIQIQSNITPPAEMELGITR